MTSQSSSEPIAFRETETFALTRAIAAHRVVVLTGPPGIGKSALAIAFAHQKKRLGKQQDTSTTATPNVVMCRLEDARAAIDIVHEIARALGIGVSAGADAAAIAERIGRVLATRRRVLVILDDADRSRVALAKLLHRWLREAPACSFLVTARGRLGVADEHRLEVGPLDVPAAREKDPEIIARAAAVQLFARRAATARAGFRITASNARTVSSIVRKLEGVPLAIELCASRMVALSERDIAELLEERLDLLEDERGERSIRSAFALSWEELGPEDARLFAACSCFRGGFLLDAACAVAVDDDDDEESDQRKPNAKARVRIARGLERLVEASLLRVDEPTQTQHQGAGGGGGGLTEIEPQRRYTIAETLRVFAAEKLAKTSDGASTSTTTSGSSSRRNIIEERHARHYAGLRTRMPPPGLETIAMERKNLEAAFDRSLRAGDSHGVAALLAYAPVALTRGPLAPFIERTGRALERLVDLTSADRAELLYSRGLAHVFQGKRDDGLIELAQAREHAQRRPVSHRVEALATSKIAVVTGLKGKVDEALSLFNEARVAADASKDDLTQGIVRKDLANILSEAGRNDDAVVELGRARKYLRAAGDIREEGFVLMMLGSRFVDDGRLTEARRDCTAALALLRQASDRRSEAWTLCLLSLVDAEEGELPTARRHLDAALGLIRDVGDEHTEGLLLGFLGNVALEQGVLADAESAYRDAVIRLARAGDRASEGLFTAAAAVVEHALGRDPSARDGFDRARELLEGDGRAARREAVEILASIMGSDSDPEPTNPKKRNASTTDKRERASLVDEEEPKGVEEIRFARRIVASMSARAKTKSAGRGGSREESDAKLEEAGIVVASDGSWVRRAAGPTAKLGVGRPIARVMHQLALARVRHPGRPVAPQLLVRAGWPGERVLPAAAKNRLHVTIARLRRVVLEGALIHDDEGYFLDPKEDARLADPDESPSG